MKTSAGLLVYRRTGGVLEVLLAHPGGPLWRRKDLGAWMIPKGELEPGEAALAGALREFQEETGLMVEGRFQPLSPIRQRGGKQVLCWAVQADLDLAGFTPGTFELEWPPRSGRRQSVPEIDRLQYFGLEEARVRILASQATLLDQLAGLTSA